MKRIPLRSVDRDDTQHLQDEIEKLQSAQNVMLEANRALELGDELTLIRLGLDPARIAELEQRHLAGKKGVSGLCDSQSIPHHPAAARLP